MVYMVSLWLRGAYVLTRGMARDKVSGVVFACVPERRTPYLLSTTLIHSISVSVLIYGNLRNRRRSE
jgi:hypothetical protein